MDIRHHGPDIPRRVGFSIFGIFDRVEVRQSGRVEMHAITFVERVDLAAGGDGNFGMGQNELA